MATTRSTSTLDDILNILSRRIRLLESRRSVVVGRFTIQTNDSGVLVAVDSVTGREFVIANPDAEE